MSIPGDVKCLRCSGDVELIGKLPLLTGKHSAAAKLFLGQWAEMDERPWFVDVYRCTTCHHVEMFDLNEYAGEAAP